MKDKLGVNIPVPHVPEETKSVFKFLKPSNISVVGSFNSGCMLGPTITVDVMVEMPAESFRKQDYQNYMYFRKKAMYLAFVTSNIGNDIAESKKFVSDGLRPCLKLRPNGKLNKKIDVMIHISAQETSFKLNRFLPEKNSVRPRWYFNKKSSNNGKSIYFHEKLSQYDIATLYILYTKQTFSRTIYILYSITEALLPTPHYNSLILHDLVMRSTNSAVAETIREYPNLRDGIILLKIWLRQRELDKGYDGFTGHIMTMFVVYLLSIKKLNTFMSSYQIVRNVWICLGNIRELLNTLYRTFLYDPLYNHN